ncbi:MAG TPA: sugar phosphate nucleotidyltransferase [Acidimicrobiia bacterium]|nr:sugar phosphate nucleotidyltransferase [Acidimicrobiia bacterium]
MTLPVAILAGGEGTRVAHLTSEQLPKAMLPLNDRPFVDYQLANLADQGIRRVLLLVGYGGETIRRHVENGSRFGLEVDYAFDGPKLLGTGGAIRAALGRLPAEFWVTYGDTLLQVPIEAVEERFLSSSLTACMTVLRNRDRWETSNVAIEGDLVAAYEKGAAPGTYDYIDYGMILFRRVGFERFATGEVFDLADLLTLLVRYRQLGWFEVEDRFYDIGTEERYRATSMHVEEGEAWGRLRG